MRVLKFFPIISSAFLLLTASCNSSPANSKENTVTETPAGNTASRSLQNDSDNAANSIAKNVNTPAFVQELNEDSMLA